MRFRRIGMIVGAWLMLSRRAGSGAGAGEFPEPPDPHRHSLFAGQRRRRVCAHHRAEHAGAVEGLDRRRIQIRRQWLDRRRGSRARGARRLHMAAGDDVFHREPGAERRSCAGIRSAISFRSARSAARRISSSCPTALPVKNVAEYVALAKAKPGTLNYSHPGKGSTGHLGFELFKRLAGIDVTGDRLSRLSADGAGYCQRPDHLDLPVRQPGAGAGADRRDPDHRRDQRRPLEIFPRRADHGRAGLCRGAGDAVVRRRGARGHAAAGRRADQQGAGGGAGDAGRPAKARRGRLRGQERAAAGSSPTSSRPTSRCGPRWSRRPASPPTEASRRFRPG